MLSRTPSLKSFTIYTHNSALTSKFWKALFQARKDRLEMNDDAVGTSAPGSAVSTYERWTNWCATVCGSILPRILGLLESVP